MAPRNFEVAPRFFLGGGGGREGGREGGMCAIPLYAFTNMCLKKGCLDKLYSFTSITVYGQ